MKNEHLDDEHEHVTRNFGTVQLMPSIVGMVFRVKRPRDYRDPKLRDHLSTVLQMWAIRWSNRNDVVAGPVLAGPIGPGGDVPPDAFALSFLTVPVPYPDWECFSAFMIEPLLPQSPGFAVTSLGQLLGIPQAPAPDGSPVH